MYETALSNPASFARVAIVSCISLVLIASSFAQVSPEPPKSKMSKKELKALLADAKTARDHQEIAAYFAQQAQILEKKSQEYETKCAEVAEHPIKTKYPSAYDDCRFWSQHYALKSTEAENEAKLHEQLAKGLKETEKAIASKRTREMIVLLVNDSGKLTAGENSVCVLALSKATQSPVAIQNVSIELTLRVGRNQGQPKTAQLSQERAGRYCGHVDLGQQYYSPANYYTVVWYAETRGRKRKIGFFVTVK